MTKYYVLTEANTDDFEVATAAIMSCGVCGGIIDGMGGGGDREICEECAVLIRTGKLFHYIDWRGLRKATP